MGELKRWNQNGPVQYDYAINGLPFLGAASTQFPYARETAEYRKQQIDASNEPGEQALQGWLYRSQSSFDLGAGARFLDTARDPFASRRFADSQGVSVFEAGKVTLLNTLEQIPLNEPGEPEVFVREAVAYSSTHARDFMGLTVSANELPGILVATTSQIWRIYSVNTSSQNPITYERQLLWTKTGLFDTQEEPRNLIVVGDYYYFVTNTNYPKVWRGSTLDWSSPEVIYTTSQQIFYSEYEDGTAYQNPYQPVWINGNATADSALANALYLKPNSLLGYFKDRLWVFFGKYAWTVPANPAEFVTGTPVNLNPVIGTGKYDLTFVIEGSPVAIADGPAAVFIAANIPNQRAKIYAAKLDEYAGGGLIPTINAVTTVAELPNSEELASMISHLGTYLILGTSSGVRVAGIDGQSGLVMGPLSLLSDGRVNTLYADGNFVWAGGAKEVDPTVDTIRDAEVNDVFGNGLYRIDLSRQLGDTLRFAWHRDLLPASVGQSLEPTGARAITQVPADRNGNVVGQAKTPMVLVDGFLWIEHLGKPVATAWLKTGRIRFETSEKKIFQELRLSFAKSVGGVEPTVSVNEDGQLPLVIDLPSKLNGIDVRGSYDLDPKSDQTYVFTFTRNSETSADLNFAFEGYQLKALFAGVRQRIIRVPLLCMARETTSAGRTIERPVWDRISKLEELEETGAAILFQDFGTNETRICIVDQLQFFAQYTPETRKAKNNPDGIMIATLRSVSPVLKNATEPPVLSLDIYSAGSALGRSLYDTSFTVDLQRAIPLSMWTLALKKYGTSGEYQIGQDYTDKNGLFNTQVFVSETQVPAIYLSSTWLEVILTSYLSGAPLGSTPSESVVQKMYIEVDADMVITNFSYTDPND